MIRNLSSFGVISPIVRANHELFNNQECIFEEIESSEDDNYLFQNIDQLLPHIKNIRRHLIDKPW